MNFNKGDKPWTDAYRQDIEWEWLSQRENRVLLNMLVQNCIYFSAYSEGRIPSPIWTSSIGTREMLLSDQAYHCSLTVLLKSLVSGKKHIIAINVWGNGRDLRHHKHLNFNSPSPDLWCNKNKAYCSQSTAKSSPKWLNEDLKGLEKNKWTACFSLCFPLQDGDTSGFWLHFHHRKENSSLAVKPADD